MEVQGISLFLLYSDLKKCLLEVTSEQYSVESAPYKDVPETVLKRGPWVEAIVQGWLIILLSS